MKDATKSYQAKPADVERNWVIVDAAGKPLGRIATEVALMLRGKRKPTFTPHVDTGDFVVVVNARKVLLTGNKLADKVYYRHSAWVGSLKETTAGELLDKHPDRVIKFAVKGMLPKNKLGRKLLTKLKVYAGSDHPHGAQKPQPVKL
ncbi:MAG: 50S ribosomal protein L13 [Deltaproteobacteria bacterium]|nr:50S ribosomal protein L13 [Deltaproteobacteria bacterium]